MRRFWARLAEMWLIVAEVMIALASTLGVHVCELFHDFDEASQEVLATLKAR